MLALVTPAALEPLPGWVDSLNGPMGLLVAAGKGVLRSMHAKSENKAQVIPVDIAINASIIIAQKLGSAKDKLIRKSRQSMEVLEPHDVKAS